MIKEEILKSFMHKNVLVTGGTGLIGRQIVEMLCNAGASVKIASLDRNRVDARAEHILADLADFSVCNELAKDMDYVFHIAGVKGSIDVTTSKPASFFVPLVMMNTNMLEASRLNKVQKLVYTSSIGAYSSSEVFRETQSADGPPMDMYPGWAKRMAELQIEAYKIQYGISDYSVVRPCNVYGPGDNFDPKNAMVIPTIMSRILKNENPVIVWGDGSAVRDFAFSRDCAEGVILALYHGTKGHPFLNLGSGVECTIRELIETLNSFLQFNYIFDTTKPSGFPRRVMDISLAREVIDFRPSTSLREGLEETWKWLVSNRDEYLSKKNYFKPEN
jgi:GDP-L-fucose synthase